MFKKKSKLLQSKKICSVMLLHTYIQFFRQDYNVVSHTTCVVILSINGGINSFKIDRFFEKLFMAIFIYSLKFVHFNL